MRNYEVTFIVDPVLSGDEIKATAQKYVDQLQEVGASIVHVDEMGLRQLAYEINKRHAGYYYCIEFQSETTTYLTTLELNMRRDERLLRFLTIALDKYGVKYNADKRSGLIGKAKRKTKATAEVAGAGAAPAAVAPKAKIAKAQPPQPDNLKRIEGIGPKIAEVLKASGVDSFAKLASMTPDQIKDLLNQAGDRFSFQDPATWPAQSQLAAQGEWDKLKKWQDELKGGKLVNAPAASSAPEVAAAVATTAASAVAVAAVATEAAAGEEE
ncbi:MAG: 30S ribosomal protein S6 [Saprospiraceae bacterium]|nr:30S ribosomal protein S6 [Saprospiraceae bacterium]